MPEDPMDEIIAVCTECKSDNPDSYVEKNPFYLAGAEHIPCKFCKGKLKIVPRKARNSTLAIEDRRRGLNHMHHSNPSENRDE